MPIRGFALFKATLRRGLFIFIITHCFYYYFLLFFNGSGEQLLLSLTSIGVCRPMVGQV